MELKIKFIINHTNACFNLMMFMYPTSFSLQNFQHKEPTKQESGFSLWKVLKYLMIAVLAFVFIDIYTTKGYKGE